VIPIKSGYEIDGMRAAGRAAASVLGRVAELVRPGISTRDLDSAAADYMIDEGCSSAFLGYRGFPGHACISVNEEVVHGIGGERRLQEGDVVKIDIGVVKGKWIGDNARTVAVGLVSEEALRLIEATSEALRLGVAAARAGRRLGDVSAAIQSLVESRGFSVVREFVGHGVGRNLHEEPQIPNFGKAGTGPRLKAGMTLAIEPMVNVGRAGVRILGDEWTVVTSDGKLSAHFEHTVLVTRDEAEILTWGGAR
jgi:methionyl aminopeptidase